MMLDPDFVIRPLAKGTPVVGRTRIFCHVSVHGLPPELLLAIVIDKFVVVTVTAMVAPLVSPLMFLLALEPPFINTVGAGELVANTNPLGTFRTIVPTPTSPPLEGSWYTGPVRLVYAPPAVVLGIASPPVAGVNGDGLTVWVKFAEVPPLKFASPLYTAVTV